jgi:uncharacterized repeat protein (TIGR01451 family)
LAVLPFIGACGAAMGTLPPQRFATVPRDHTEATVYYPKGDVTESVLMLRTSGPKTIRAGQQFEYKIELYNPTDKTIVKNIAVSDYLSPQFELVSSTPSWTDLNRRPKTELTKALRTPHADLDDPRKAAPRMVKHGLVSTDTPHEADQVGWFIEELYPEKLVTIRVRGRATKEGRLMSCASASYELGACMAAEVVAPELQLTAELDREFVICQRDTTDLSLRVRNPGSGRTDAVTVTVQLPDGLSHQGRQTINANVGALAAGESKTMTKPLTVHAPGQYTVQASAQSGQQLKTEAASLTLVARQPQLEIETTAPQEEYVGLPVEYEVKVRNVGNAIARNVVLASDVPNNAKFVDASHNGQLTGNKVQWQVDRLAPGESVTVSARFRGQDTGHLRTVASASSRCVSDLTDIARTELQGVATMLVEVVDNRDPVRVGADEIYEVRVHNQGSAPETDLVVTCTLPEGTELLSADGATKPRSGTEAKRVVFHPVAQLAADDTATWHVKVRGTNAGDKRFRVEVDSDQHGRPVRETEATRVIN